ncbi:MAG: SulP family inorganic anion transporter [Flavobacteriaceae bacterium]
MQRFLPFLHWFPGYRMKDVPKDLLAGTTVGIVLVPQAMAYAMIAGLPPVYGLYAALFPLLIYVLLGTSRPMAIGPVAMDSLLVAIGLGAMALSDAQYVSMAIFLALIVGIMQLALGLLRMGYLVNFISKPVINAFTSAAALIIMMSQLKHLFGVQVGKSNRFHEMIWFAFQKLSEINFFDLGIGILGIVLIVGLKKWNKKIPGILLAVVLGTLSVYLLDLETRGVEIVGSIPSGLPFFEVPEINMDAFAQLWPVAITLALVGYMETVSIGKGIEDKSEEDRLDPNQELVALGTSNIVGSFFKSYPVAASFSRSYISNEAGARSNFAGLFAALLVLATLIFLTPLFYYLPNAVLASIIMVSVYGLVDIGYSKRLWKLRKDEFAVWIITFLATLFVGIVEGIVIGVILALLLMVYRTSKPHIAVLGKIRNSDYYKNVDRFIEDVEQRDDLLILRFDAQLYFGNTSYFKNQLFRFIEKNEDGLKAVILNAEAINYIDSTAAHMLRKVINEIKSKGVRFYIVGAIGPTRDILFSSGIADIVTKEYLFVRVKEAVDHFDSIRISSDLSDKVASQRNSKS